MNTKLLIALLLLLTVFPVMAQDANLTDGCVVDYDADFDYFPNQVEVVDAKNFAVEYFNNYKVVTVSDAFDSAPEFHYVLVQCGTLAPSANEFPEDTQFIEVPTGDVITLSTTQLPTLTHLGLLNHLVGVDSFDYINTDEAIALIEADELVAVGFSADINVELVLSLEPDMVMTYGFDPATDAHPVLLEAGIFTAMDASWRELSPLGRAEWLKFTAVFYNVEADANALYTDIKTQYQDAQQLAQSVAEDNRPTVLINSFLSYADAWFIPGEDTYVGQLVRDAGGQLILTEEGSTQSNGLSLETVYEGALDADIWLADTFAVNTQDDMLALDERFGDFEALQSGNIWNNNRDENENYGNNYYELGVTNPHLILLDLVAIFHPELLPDHEFTFYQQLEATE
jgi:iron complex transport system substrate-binding protein